ncbi:hypothetical protein SprV_0200853800 [Sparganum proliferum]
MGLRLPLCGDKFATTISAYTPTIACSGEAITKLNKDPHTLLTSVQKADKLIVVDDFNALAGADCAAWRGVLGSYGIANCKENGLLLLRTCAEHRLLLTTAFFCLPMRKKAAWINTPSRRWQQLDYVLVRWQNRQDVRVTKPTCEADGWPDHHFVISKMKLDLPDRRRPQDQGDPGICRPRRLKNFFTAIKAIYSTSSEVTAPLLNSDGLTLLTEMSQMLKRWAENFRNVLSRSSTISVATNARLPNLETDVDLDLRPSFPETVGPVQQHSSKKASGFEAIPAEIYNHGGHCLIDQI